MGYCTDRFGRLSCDSCGESGGVRKVRCPFGYCSAPALCPACKVKHTDKLTKAYHRAQGCERRHNECVASDQERASIILAGGFVRRSALGINVSRVHVLFAGKDGATAGYFMSPETYHSFPLLVNVTPEMFASKRTIEPAPSEYDWGKPTKQVRCEEIMS